MDAPFTGGRNRTGPKTDPKRPKSRFWTSKDDHTRNKGHCFTACFKELEDVREIEKDQSQEKHGQFSSDHLGVLKSPLQGLTLGSRACSCGRSVAKRGFDLRWETQTVFPEFFRLKRPTLAVLTMFGSPRLHFINPLGLRDRCGKAPGKTSAEHSSAAMPLGDTEGQAFETGRFYKSGGVQRYSGRCSGV